MQGESLYTAACARQIDIIDIPNENGTAKRAWFDLDL
jgi:hypothetical protein